MKEARIAIPIPHSSNSEYAERAIPQYEHAAELAGGEALRIPLDQSRAEVLKMIARCDGVLLPGSNADIDPAKFRAPRSPRTASSDPRRDAVDSLLLEDAYRLKKPVLGICYGLQSLNVFRAGSLIQHIPDFLPEETRTKVDHSAGKMVTVAHTVKIENSSRLAEIVKVRKPESDGGLFVAVNSSHHQSVGEIGQELRVAARCPDDGIIEAIEGTAPDHFVMAVQWHPERSVDEDEVSLGIFRALITAARTRG